MSWANPEYFWLLFFIPIFIAYVAWKLFFRKQPAFTFSSTASLKNLPGNYKAWLVYLTPLFYVAAFGLIVIAMARPQLQNTTVERHTEGIDIMLSIDISTSMRAEDFEPNRMLAAKEIAGNFINNRRSDRIGLNVFARESFTVCPPTVDHRLALQLLDTIDMGMVRDGTAIGVGLATAVNRLRSSEAESKVIILLTDGMNNAGEVDPITAGEIAASQGITVYTMGIGTRGTAPYPVDDPVFGRRYQNVSVDIDEEMLRQIADMTGGKYFRATDNREMIEIYEEIDRLETTEIEEIVYRDYEDRYMNFLLSGVLLFMAGFLNERLFTRSPLFHS